MSEEENSKFLKENMDQDRKNSKNPKINVVASVSNNADTIDHAEILNSKKMTH